jgi:hypothetical protein
LKLRTANEEELKNSRQSPVLTAKGSTKGIPMGQNLSNFTCLSWVQSSQEAPLLSPRSHFSQLEVAPEVSPAPQVAGSTEPCRHSLPHTHSANFFYLSTLEHVKHECGCIILSYKNSMFKNVSLLFPLPTLISIFSTVFATCQSDHFFTCFPQMNWYLHIFSFSCFILLFLMAFIVFHFVFETGSTVHPRLAWNSRFF